MSDALERIIAGYLKLSDIEALRKMKAHRENLIAGLGSDGPFDQSFVRNTLKKDLTLIDGGLQKMRGLDQLKGVEHSLSKLPLPLKRQ